MLFNFSELLKYFFVFVVNCSFVENLNFISIHNLINVVPKLTAKTISNRFFFPSNSYNY